VAKRSGMTPAAASTAALLALAPGSGVQGTGKDRNGRVRSADGVEIVYSARGAGETALVFIHGGLADREFWAPQLSALADAFRVVALDLGGHGSSGRNRKARTIAAFGEDARAVVEALALKRVVLIGNSLGGPVALEAAGLLRGRVLGVIAVDTLHDATAALDPAESRKRAAAFRIDFSRTCRAMVSSLFHKGMQQELHAWAERRMCAMPPAVVADMMDRFSGYDLAAAVRAAGVPIRAINGDLWPTDIERTRSLAPDFNAVILKGAGH
jgi:sigma-B regulation protein RsbQ